MKKEYHFYTNKLTLLPADIVTGYSESEKYFVREIFIFVLIYKSLSYIKYLAKTIWNENIEWTNFKINFVNNVDHLMKNIKFFFISISFLICLVLL